MRLNAPVGKQFSFDRFMALEHEAWRHGCTVERFEGRGKGYTFTSCDTGPAGVWCKTLDEVDEEMEKFRG